jgi:hypothetical protein
MHPENFILFMSGIVFGGLIMLATIMVIDSSSEVGNPDFLPKKIPTIEHHYFYPPPIQLPCPEKRVS